MATDPAGARSPLYHWLVDRQARRNVFDAHVFACILARRWPLGLDGLGLDAPALGRLLEKYFPGALSDPPPCLGDGGTELPERDTAGALRGMLLNHRSTGVEEEEWLAGVVARACLDQGALWRDLGLDNTRDLNALMARHFGPLEPTNRSRDCWKAVLFRLLPVPDTSPECTRCPDHGVCDTAEA